MRKTQATGKRVTPDSQQVNRPAKRKTMKVNGKLLALIAAVVVVIIALCLILPRVSTSKNVPEKNIADENITDDNITDENIADEVDTELLGTWSFNDEATYSFDNQKMGLLDLGEMQFTYTYSVSGNKLALDYEDESVEDAEYQFSVDGDQLTLEGGEGTTGGTYQLSRVG